MRSSVILQSAWLPAKAAMPSFFSAAEGKIGGVEQRPRHEGGDVVNETRILRPGDHPLAHDDVGLEQLHHRQRQRIVVMQQRRYEAGRELGLLGQGQNS